MDTDADTDSDTNPDADTDTDNYTDAGFDIILFRIPLRVNFAKGPPTPPSSNQDDPYPPPLAMSPLQHGTTSSDSSEWVQMTIQPGVLKDRDNRDNRERGREELFS